MVPRLGAEKRLFLVQGNVGVVELVMLFFQSGYLLERRLKTICTKKEWISAPNFGAIWS